MVRGFYNAAYETRLSKRVCWRSLKVNEEAVSTTSEVLREIKTVRQFAMEPREAVNYARKTVARDAMVGRVQVRGPGADLLRRLRFSVLPRFLSCLILLRGGWGGVSR